MIVRQEDYEKLKSDKMKERQSEIKNKINEECIFSPNGKKNIISRNPNAFFNDQLKFIEKKEEIINKMTQNIIDNETKNSNAILISKNSEKLANKKNQNISQADFCKRLAKEKLKTIKEEIEEKKEEKKLTKKELKNLTEKLYKEGETFKNNRVKMEKEQLDKIKKIEKNFVLQKSKKVLFEKFISNYRKILNDLYNKKDNFQITYDEYNTILINLGFIKNNNSPTNENLIRESFYNYLKPNNEKIDTYSFLLFSLTILGIYKGNDEKIEEHSSKITISKNEEEKRGENQKYNNILNENSNNKSLFIDKSPQKNQIKSSSELIKSYFPDLNFDKYGYSRKDCKLIKTKFLPFVSRIRESWAKDLSKKKQERLDKLEEINKRNSHSLNEDSKKLENKLKKEEEILNSYRKRFMKKDLFSENIGNNSTKEKKYNLRSERPFKVEDMFEILQKKKKRKLEVLKAKYDEDILQECTFQPNLKTKPVNKKEVAKNIEKLYLDGKESYIRKKRQEKKDLDLNTENDKNYTFRPMIKDYKGKYFENNPLKEDRFYNMELKKMEKIRENKRYSKKKVKKQMAFGIETKFNKESISNRVITNKSVKNIRRVKNEFEAHNNLEGQPYQNLLKIMIKLENDKVDLLVIRPEDNFIKVIDDFCNKHDLPEEKRIRLIEVIKDKISDNEN